MRYDVHYRQDLNRFDELEGISPQDRVVLVDGKGNELERYFVKRYPAGHLYLDSEPDPDWKACRMWPK